MILVSRRTMALLVSICMVLHVLVIPVAAADTGNAPLKNSTLGASSGEKEEVQSNLPAMLAGEMTFTDYFPDPEFAKAVAAALSKEPADWVTGADLLQVTSISVYNSHSDIKSLEGISHLSNLRWLTIADAPQLKTLPQEMNSLQHFSSISLINCGFTEFPLVLLDIAGLDHIQMTGNALTEIPDGLGRGDRQILVFNENQLTRLPDDFWGDSVFAVQAESNYLTERMPERAFYDGEFFLSKQTAVLAEQSVSVGGALHYEALLTPLALQIQELCDGELFGMWNITEPDGTERSIPAVDGSEMSQYRFEEPGSYQIEYQLDGYVRADGTWFDEPPYTISELTVSGTVVAQESSAEKPFLEYFPDPEFAKLVAGKLNREVTDTVTEEELYYNIVGLNNQLVQVGEIQSIEGIEYLNLETFYLQNTALQELPDTFNWGSCFEFALVNNRYPLDIPSSFGTMTNVANLKLDNTQIRSIHPAVNNMRNLGTVSLDSCGLTEVPEFVKNQQGLTELSMNYNYISEIPEGLGTGNLKFVRFYGNMIHNIADDFWENDFISADLKNNRLTARLHEKAFSDGDIGLWNQSDYLGEREVELNGSLPYQELIPLFVQQIQELHNDTGTLKGSWHITAPDNQVDILPAVDGSEMSAYVFTQTGEYTVAYQLEGSEFYLFEIPGFSRSSVGELCYTTTITVGEEPGIKTFLDFFPDANLAQAVAEMTGKSSSDATNEVELAGLLRINGNSRGIASLEGIHYLTGVTELSLYNNSIAQLPPEMG